MAVKENVNTKSKTLKKMDYLSFLKRLRQKLKE